jgi:hypothetical protein
MMNEGNPGNQPNALNTDQSTTCCIMTTGVPFAGGQGTAGWLHFIGEKKQ